MPRGAAPTRGVSVYRRGDTWSYRIDIEVDQVSGERRRENRGGYATEDLAWSAALETRQRHRTGRRIDSSRRTVSQFFDEWLVSVGNSLKPSTQQYYSDYLRAYILPALGRRQLRDVTVPMLNLFYGRLLDQGRSRQMPAWRCSLTG